MENHFSPNYCNAFDKTSSGLDYMLALMVIEFVVIRLYYAFRFPYGMVETWIRAFPFLGFLASKKKSEEKKNEDAPQTQIHEEKFAEPVALLNYIKISANLSLLIILAYFRMDRFSIVQNSILNYIAPYLSQLSRVVICSGDITFIPRDSFVATFFRIMGLIIVQCSLLFMVWVQQEMQASWTPVIHLKQDHKLITSGPFQIVRHPMYFSFLFMSFGIGLASWNWFLSLYLFVSFGAIFFRIPIEEKLLIQTYGEEYQKYRATVKYAIIPFVY